MKILVFSDSHSSMRFMKKCVERIKPDSIIHLGDMYGDGETLAELFPHIPVHQVKGNCDGYFTPMDARDMLCYPIGGVMMYLCHGHREDVKRQGTAVLALRAREYGAKIALYGHTHRIDCHQEADGLWIFNPGAAKDMSAGLLKTENGAIKSCYTLTEIDLEDWK